MLSVWLTIKVSFKADKAAVWPKPILGVKPTLWVSTVPLVLYFIKLGAAEIGVLSVTISALAIRNK